MTDTTAARAYLEQSKGAQIEVGLARDANLPVIELDRVAAEFGRARG